LTPIPEGGIILRWGGSDLAWTFATSSPGAARQRSVHPDLISQEDSVMDFENIVDNVRRAVTFDRTFYQEAATQERYQKQALTVVVVVALLAGIGSFLGGIITLNFLGAIVGLALGVLLAIVGYYIWAYVVQFVGKQFFQGQATAPQLLRTLGYAYAPQALGVLGFIPCIGWAISLAGALWSLGCGYFAVRETEQFSDGKAILTVLIGWVIVMVVVAVIGGIVAAVFGITSGVFGAAFGR
jgi:hypothetical protein